ncbi:hypothetical protein ACFSSA_05630 [Luteolibacter algae]|uniref:Uncharacterized protein n=1 Tax=Luteolibacter algae TaxID=454151 RepID=A0ABW5D522_9BACT
MGTNALGKGAEVIDFGFAIRPLSGTEPVDLGYQSFPTDMQASYKTLRAGFNSASPYLAGVPEDIRYLGYHLGTEGNPEFQYTIGKTDIRQKVELLSKKSMKLKFTFAGGKDPIRFKVDTTKVQLHTSAGKIERDILTIPAGTESVTLTLVKP